LLTAAALVTLAAAGCGSSSSSGSSEEASSKSPTQLIEAAATASKGAKSVKLDVKASGSEATEVEVVNVPGKGVKGKVNEKGKQAEFIVTGGAFYIKGGEALFSQAGSAAGLLSGKWLKIPSGSANLGSFSQISELPNLLNQNLSKLKSKQSNLTKTGEKTIDGKTVVGLTGTENGQKGTIYVEAAEPHYPVALESAAAGGGTVKATFSAWNEPAEVSAPANAVDLSSLLG